jgi:hypothetical protein
MINLKHYTIMKKIILSVAAVFAFGFANAQEVKFGAKAGVNFSTFTGDAEDVDGKVGFQVGAFAEIIGDEILFKGCLFSLDGQSKLEIERKVLVSEYKGFGKECAKFILSNGGSELMSSIKNQMG